MQLTLQSQKFGDIAVIRCHGRVVVGPELSALQLELETLTRLTKKVVLQLAEVTFIDSAGVGAVVRQLGSLRSYGGDLKLCQVSPFVLKVLQVTNLLGVLPSHASENEAILAFSDRPRSPKDSFEPANTSIVCIDTSHDLLAYVSALLKRSGYEVLTSSHPSDAATLVRITRPRILICGPGMQTNEIVIEGLRKSAPKAQLLLLPLDFSAAEAGQAGTDLVNQVRSLIAAKE